MTLLHEYCVNWEKKKLINHQAFRVLKLLNRKTELDIANLRIRKSGRINLGNGDGKMSAFSALLFIIRCRTIELLSELKRQADFTETYFTRISLCKEGIVVCSFKLVL